MKPLALCLVLWAGAAQADWKIWSPADARQILDCAVVIEMFEAPDGEPLPMDFAASAEALRQSVMQVHGEAFMRQVTEERRNYWQGKAHFDAGDAAFLRGLLAECATWVSGAGK